MEQSFDSYEHIVWDGGSEDETLAIIEHYPHIKLFQGKDKGIADAMNRAAAHASGEYLLHLHGDDCLANRDTLLSVERALKAHVEPAWLYGQAHIIDANDRVLKTTPFEYYSAKRLRKYNFITHPATFVSREIFKKLGGFRPQWKYCMDYDLWLRLSEVAPPFALRRPLACFRAHIHSLSTNEPKGVANEAYAVRNQYLKSPLERLRSYMTWKRRLNKILKGF